MVDKIYKIPYGVDSFLYRNKDGDVFYAQGNLDTFLYTHELQDLDYMNFLNAYSLTSKDLDWYDKNINNLIKINTATHPAFQG